MECVADSVLSFTWPPPYLWVAAINIIVETNISQQLIIYKATL